MVQYQYNEQFNPNEVDLTGKKSVKYRTFISYPFVGVVVNKNGSRGFKDKEGRWKIYDSKNKIHMVAHIIYGARMDRKGQISYEEMKKRIVKHKNGNLNDNRISNLESKVKKKYLK